MLNSVYDINQFVTNSVIVIILFGIVLWVLGLFQLSKLEKRFSKFSIPILEKKELSVTDKIILSLKENIQKLSKTLYKLKIFNDYSKKYEKYLDNSKIIRDDPMDYISIKVLSGLGIVILMFVSCILASQTINFFKILASFLMGFFILDAVLISNERYRKKQIEKEMLKAIIIMNNSFKSGLSIMQAIYMVTTELEGPIKDEFKKVYIDLSFGLDMEVVFERFTNRIDTKEAKYIATSLNVLNKTGGNIVQVFASVERNSFTSKKIQEELGALTASASAIFKVLVVIPILLFMLIFVLNPTYFAPLFTDPLGLFLLLLIFVIYISYIIIIRRVMKVKVNL